MRVNSLAFSLVELLITIGIISLLTTIAVYSYPTYIAKSQVAAAISIIDAYKTAIQSYFVENGNMPLTTPPNITPYTSENNDPISSVSYSGGTTPTIQVNFGSNASKLLSNKNIILQISIDNSAINFSGYYYGGTGLFTSTCTATGIANNILPT